MRKPAVFATGMTVGVISVPLAVVFIKPVRNLAVLGTALAMSVIFTTSAEARESGRKHAQAFIDILDDIETKAANKNNPEEGK